MSESGGAGAELDDLFERSSPLARRLLETGPHPDPVAAARRLVPVLSEADKVATLNAHPRIGAPREALSSRSRAEQGQEPAPQLAGLNEAYERRFGFRFVTFVNRRPRSEVAQELRRRLEGGREEELAAGLRAILDIAEDRRRP